MSSILDCGTLTGCGTTDAESSDDETPPTRKKGRREDKSKRGRRYKGDGIGRGSGCVKRGRGRGRGCVQVTKSSLKGISESGR